MWVSTTKPTALRSFWKPEWTRRDTKSTLLWFTVPPIVWAVFIAGLWTTREPTQSDIVISVLVMLALWPLFGGLLIRTRGRWREVPVVSGAFTLVVCAVYLVVLFSRPDPQNQNDHVAGIGVVFTAAVLFPPALLLVGLGRGIRRAGSAAFGRRATDEPCA